MPTFLVVDPTHFEVAYTINPWMQPSSWRANPVGMRQAARVGFNELVTALGAAGAGVEMMAGAEGAPDLVFPANAAVVLDGRAVMARFRHGERQVEEPLYQGAFEALQARGLVGKVLTLADGELQEGAGDFIWDASRRLFWAGHGPRSNLRGLNAVKDVFGQETVPLELATAQFYHLDTCLCPLPGGEVLYYPPAFTAAGVRAIKDHVAPEDLLEASDEDAARFCVNAVAWERTIVMADAADRLRGGLQERGYRITEINLAPFILSGGGAYCMTLRLDRQSAPIRTAPAPILVLEQSL